MEGDGYFTNLMHDGLYNETLMDNDFQQTPPINDSNPSVKANQKHKGKNFNEDEDRLLISAWLNVSTDSTQGANQTRDTFWKRIYLYYEANKGDLGGNISERTQNSLLHRWGVIQEAVSKFCGCIISIDNRNQSGMTIHDRVEQAEILFKEQDLPKHRPFTFRHCWLVLRNQPKWLDKLRQLAEIKASNKKQKTTKISSPGIVDLTTQDGNDKDPPETVIPEIDAPKRPLGKKKAKEALRRGGSDACTESLELLWAKKREDDAAKELKREERYTRSYALDKERLELDKERIELDKERIALEREKLSNEANNTYLKRIAEEERIINMDLSSLNEMQQQYYMNLQSEIITRRMN